MRDYSKLTKPTPEKYCAYCGKKLERKRFNGRLEDLGVFNKRKFCNIECMKRGFVKKDGLNQKNEPAHSSARKIAYMIEERDKICELCGSTKSIDVHHKDGDFHNNSPENLMIVCRSCHMKLHKTSSRTCSVCGKECKRTHRGMCDKHYFRWKKYGDPNHRPWSTYIRKKQENESQQLTLF